VKPSTIAIDGPAAAGKSTIGELLARRLGYLYFDTGAMYRAVTWVALEQGVDIADEEAITALAKSIVINITRPTVDDGRQYTVCANGQDVTWQIRRPEVDANVSPVSAYPGVRQALTEQQRRIGRRGRIIMMGRDIGTVVLPEADLKIYLGATAEERARRRHHEILERGEEADYEKVLASMRQRDKIDSEREAAPLHPADDAVIIDTTGLSIAEVLAKVEELVRSPKSEVRSPKSEVQGPNGKGRAIFRCFACSLLRLLFRLFTHLEVAGLEKIPQGGPLLVAFNHLAHLDAPLVLALLPWPVETIGLVDLYRVPVTGQLLRLYGTIPVHRDQFDRQVIRRALQVLAEGKVLALAPEARQSLTGALERARQGVAYLALRSGAPILPVALTGTEKVYVEWKRLRRPRLTLTFGEVITTPPRASKPQARRQQVAELTDEIMHCIAAMLPSEYRGVYAPTPSSSCPPSGVEVGVGSPGSPSPRVGRKGH
jgi:cytidylate kinase